VPPPPPPQTGGGRAGHRIPWLDQGEGAHAHRGGRGKKRNKIKEIKVLLKHLAIFYLLPSKKILPISFKIQLLETSTQKQKEQRQQQLDVSFF
jgi:hypothetical protein